MYYLAKYGIDYKSKRPRKEIDPEVIKTMLDEGLPVIQIAYKCECSRSHLYELIKTIFYLQRQKTTHSCDLFC